MPSFLEMSDQAVAAGLVGGKAQKLPDGNYILILTSAEAKASSKSATPQISLLWKTIDGQTSFQNLSFGSSKSTEGASAAIGISVSTIESLGVTRQFLAATDNLTVLAAEIERVAKGVAFNVRVVLQKPNDKGYVNNNFYVNGRAQLAPQTSAPVAIVVPASVPVPVAPAPVQVSPAQIVIQPPVQLPPAPIIPQGPTFDPTTGLPPRPGI
jgi:hypothetical protein